MNMQLCTCNFLKELCFNTISKPSFSPWHRNDTVFILYGPVYPRHGLLGYLLLGSVLPSRGTCQPELPSSPPHHFFFLFFHCNHPSSSFNHIFKFTFKYVKSPLFVSKCLCLNHQTHSLWCIYPHACMKWVWIMQLTKYICIHILTL